MEETYTLKGGARIGRANATYPFATLTVNKDILKINASVIGNLEFRHQDIISIESYSLIPILGQGIKINHRVAGYNPKVIFWTFKEPENVINDIKKTGFWNGLNNTISKEEKLILEKQRQSETPIKPLVLIVMFFLWFGIVTNSLHFFPLKEDGLGFELIRRVGISALAILFLCCILTFISSGFKRLIMRKERNFIEIKKFVFFLTLLSGFLLLSFLLTSNLIK